MSDPAGTVDAIIVAAREGEAIVSTKRCQVCREEFDPDDPDAWYCPTAKRHRHVPDDLPGGVYVLHFDEPTHLRQVDNAVVQPTTHYVGWTGQPVERRARQHGASEANIAGSWPGTAKDKERQVKRTGTCPRCGVALAPECLGRSRGKSDQRAERARAVRAIVEANPNAERDQLRALIVNRLAEIRDES